MERKNIEWPLQDIRYYNKRSNIHITRVVEGEEKVGGTEKVVKKTLAEDFPLL